jgi:chitinase
MLKFQNRIVALVVILASVHVMAQKKSIIGCYQSWQWQKFPEMLSPDNIPYDKLTVINYSFFYPQENGDIVGMEPAADQYLLGGRTDSLSLNTRRDKSIIELAQQHGTRIVLSIGGWDHSENFPQVSADPAKRINFAHACLNVIRRYGFDGIDIDWEFPGYVRHKGTPQDRDNFTWLLETLRDSLLVLGGGSGKHYLLSASLPAAAGHLPDIDVEKISSILDYLNIMTYDLFGPWGKTSNHNSALYGPAQGDSARCLDGAFRLYHEMHGVPAEKINPGVAFYGHSFAGCTEMYGAAQGADTTLFHEQDGILYSQIMEKMNLFEHFWDLKAEAPYLVSTSRKILVSFDDEKSVALKADYVIRNNAGGLIIWPLQGDRLRNGSTPLLDVISKEFSQ